MNPENEAEVETDGTEGEPDEETEQVEQDQSKPEGWEQVEMDEATQARFNRIYGQMKDAQSTVSMLREHNTQLAESMDKMNERMNSFEDSRTTETVEDLKAGIKSAAEDGDYERVAELTDRMTTLKTAPPREDKPTPKPREAPVLSASQEQEIATWMSEKDEAGNLKRPWVAPGHPLQKKAAAYGVAVLEDPDNAGKSTAEILAEVERLMAGEVRGNGAARPDVLPGSTTQRRGRRARDLTQEEKDTARKMGIKEDRYKAQLQAMGKL